MALLNIRQSLGTHGCDGNVRYWEVDCTGDPEFELVADRVNNVLDGKKLLALCPGLKPGHIIRINRVFPNGDIVPSGKCYTIIAKDTHYQYEQRDKNFIYAVCHNEDEFVRYVNVDNIGEAVFTNIDNKSVGVFSRFGVVALDDIAEESAWTLRDATNTNALSTFGAGITFTVGQVSGSVKVKERNYFSNRVYFRKDGQQVLNNNKRAVCFVVFKYQDYIEHSFYNENGTQQVWHILNEYIISARLVRIFVDRWQSSATGGGGATSLGNGRGGTATNSVAWGTNWTVKTNGDEIYQGGQITWGQDTVTTNPVRLDAYGYLYFEPIP